MAESLTTQKRGRDTVLRQLPLPTDPYSLPQAYQRWLYEDYAYLWRQQSLATRQAYQSLGSRYHLTGFQYWMKYQLTNLPDILLMYYLDTTTSPTEHDQGRNALNATIFGASNTPGTIDSAFFFDGINDYLAIPYSPLTNIPTAFTIELFLTMHDLIGTQGILTKNQTLLGLKTGYGILTLVNILTFRLGLGGAAWVDLSSTNPIDTNKHHYAFTWDGSTQTLSIDGVLDTSQPTIGSISSNPLPIAIAATSLLSIFSHCTIDHLIFRNRILDQTEILRHSQRRYPP